MFSRLDQKFKLTARYEALRQQLVSANAQFPSVELLSYHLPKTAGTSLYLALEEAYGVSHIKRVYEPRDHEPLTNGLPFWVTKESLVLHGHFRPHPNHIRQFPNAKRIIWVRDPIERCWSLLRHWLRLQNGKRYEIFKEKYIKTGEETPEELFDKLVKDPDFSDIRLMYQSFMKNVSVQHFHFVGQAEFFNSELERLGQLLGKELKSREANVNTNHKTMPFNPKDYYSLFESDYEFLEASFGISYKV